MKNVSLSEISSMEDALRFVGVTIEEISWSVKNTYTEQLKKMANEEK